MSTLVDYSLARPDPASIVSSGAAGVMRYLSHTPAKNLSAGERDALHAAGLAVGLVWETDGVTTGGAGVGASHAQQANAQADALGYPVDCPIFYATDHDYDPAAVAGYYLGVASAGGRPWGVYGGIRVVDGVAAPYSWQTAAWSAGRISDRAHIYQRVGGAPIPGIDVNDLRRPLPMWVGGLGGLGRSIGGGATLMVTPSGAPALPIAPLPPSEEDSMKPYLITSPTWSAVVLPWGGSTVLQFLSGDDYAANVTAGLTVVTLNAAHAETLRTSVIRG
ncbi:MAG: DUF1906 domain-containing protein [Propionibacterium sp.]|nr:DUF1906 domain-containing protein [Propionibacterium sp.]